MNWLIHPFKAIAGYGIRRYILGVVNDAIKTHAVSIENARAAVSSASAKLKAICRFFDSLNAHLADGVISEEEAAAAIDDAKRLAADLTAEKEEA